MNDESEHEIPHTHSGLDMLKLEDKETLEDRGLRKHSNDTGLWLLPYGWHPHIPTDYLLINTDNGGTFRHELGEDPPEMDGKLPAGIVPSFEKEKESGHHD